MSPDRGPRSQRAVRRKTGCLGSSAAISSSVESEFRVEVGPGDADLGHIPAEHRYRGRPGRLLNLETIGATAAAERHLARRSSVRDPTRGAMLKSARAAVPPNPGTVVAMKLMPDSRMLGTARRSS